MKNGLKIVRIAQNLMKLGRNPDNRIVPHTLGGVPGPLMARNGPKIKKLDRKIFGVESPDFATEFLTMAMCIHAV